MNVFTRGAKNALRSPLRSGAIVLLLAASIGLTLAMLVARSSVETKVAEVKASTATQIAINPTGVRGGLGSGDSLTIDQLKIVAATAHVKSTDASLTDQLGENETNLTPSLQLGSFGKRQMRFEQGADGNSQTPRRMPTPRTIVTGTTNPAAIATHLTSGSTLDGNTNANQALAGKALAAKNNLTIGSTFTAYNQTITVVGIFDSGNGFADNGVIFPLATLQTLTNQPGALSAITATADSSENVAGVVTALKTSLGDKADITSQQDQAKNSLAPLENISGLALAGVVGAAGTGAVILLLVMVIVVRERRREIGVIKAIGGSNLTVALQFAVEGLTLTAISAIIGLGLGIAISSPITQSLVANQSSQPQMAMGGRGLRAFGQQLGGSLHAVTSTLTPQTFALAIGITALIAVLGSTIPALLTARIRPAEVLRTE